jgi:hypothetical protein
MWTNMDKSLIEYYDSLNEKDKKILNIAALAGNFTSYEIYPVFQKFAMIPQKEVKACLDAASEQGLLVSEALVDYSVSFDFMIYVYPSLGNFEKIYDHLEKNARSFSFFHDLHDIYRAVRQALFQLLFGTEQQYGAAEKRMEVYNLAAVYVGVLEDPQYRRALHRISPAIVTAAINMKFNDCLQFLRHLSCYKDFLDALVAVTPPLRGLWRQNRKSA